MMEPLLGQQSWSLGGEPGKSTTGTGARVARLVLVPEISLYAYLKHLGVRDNGI